MFILPGSILKISVALLRGRNQVNAFMIDLNNYIPNLRAEKRFCRMMDYKKVGLNNLLHIAGLCMRAEALHYFVWMIGVDIVFIITPV